MKNHKRFEELIQGYLDNTLSGEERKGLENHLKFCETCREKLKSREELLQKLRIGREEIQCPDYLIDNILKNTTQKEVPVIISSSKIRWRYLTVSAAAVLMVITTVLLNIEDGNRILTTKKPQEILTKGDLKEEKIGESTEASLAKMEVEEIRDEKPHSESGAKTAKAPRAPLPEKEKELAVVGETKKAPLKATAPPRSIKMDFSQSKEIRSLEPASETEAVSFGTTESDFSGQIISEENFEETRFVFPEEGSVVGKNFEIVLILKDPEEAIEISLDGEQITNYIKEKDSNVIFIGSDSIPPLEEGLHYLSVKTKEEKNITFYKEG